MANGTISYHTIPGKLRKCCVRQMLDDIMGYNMHTAFHPACVYVCTSIYFNNYASLDSLDVIIFEIQQ